ncbi:histidine kinase, partial [Streptomyces eurythermus]
GGPSRGGGGTGGGGGMPKRERVMRMSVELPLWRAPAGDPAPAPGVSPLPRRVRQANLAPQLKQDTERRAGRPAQPADRDADEVRSRMASLQRGWQRGREENAAGDGAHNGTAQGTTKGDGR